ncbi:PQQ-binding-like beta-propeller repeat protein [Alienimonas sp. DA493]|uniref:outer membrane protein assembly factor BamB family protein n=1 Tax=Alienimonas sp. DA493 TaxID=3373605 RepID=UPI003753ED0E
MLVRPCAPLLVLAAFALGCEADRESVPPVAALSPDRSAVRAASGEWPNLHGPGGRNVAPDRRLNWDWPEAGPPVAWRVPCGTGYACPVIAENAVVLLHRVGPDVGPFAESAAKLGGDRPVERLAWFDLDTGAPGPVADVSARFESEYPGHSGAPYATPAIGRRGPDGGRRVYAYGAAGLLRAVDFDTAEELWGRDLAAETQPAEKPFATSASPIVFQTDDGAERVLIATGGTKPNTGLTLLDGATGEMVWQAVDALESYSTPLLVEVHGRRFVVALMKTRLLIADPATGAELGSLPFELRTVDAMNATSPAVWGDVLFVGSGPSGRTAGCMVARLEPDGSLTELWRNRRGLDPQYNSLVAADGFVYGFGSNLNKQQKLRCLDLQTGELRWLWDDDLRRGHLLAADGKLVALGERGLLAALAFDPTEPRVVTRSAEPVIEGVCYTTPALADGRLLLRTEVELVCYDLRPGADRSGVEPAAAQ